MLWKAGSSVDVKDRLGLTPLMWCAERGLVKATRLLLELGAAVEIRGKHGETALICAARRGEPWDRNPKKGLRFIDLNRNYSSLG